MNIALVAIAVRFLELFCLCNTYDMLNFYSEGGFFKAHLHFPKEYPLRPPRMKFITEIWHPNSKCVLLLLFSFFEQLFLICNLW